MAEYGFTGPLWEWSGKGGWTFITVPTDISGIIRMRVQKRAGFGSVRVCVELKGTKWKTSLFPDKKSGCYLLPVKNDIRKRANLAIGDVLNLALSLAQ